MYNMFLISKIVRGRRLLQELEAETEKKSTQEETVAESSASNLRQSLQATRAEKSMGESSQSGAGTSNANMSTSSRSICITSLIWQDVESECFIPRSITFFKEEKFLLTAAGCHFKDTSNHFDT
uniref:ZP domain-containing protein n=1 Tax=Elaeophora elaphi TaxID=1147741 RepID=A0A0R3RI38_9BILA